MAKKRTETKEDILVEKEEKDLGLTMDNLEDLSNYNVKSFNTLDQINNDFISQDEDNLLEYYVKELLISLEGIFIGGHASQKRDQLISYLYKENMGGDA